jgi:hypothetical protein
MEYKIVFKVGDTKLIVKRNASGDLRALNSAKAEALEIEQKEQPFKVTVESVTQL